MVKKEKKKIEKNDELEEIGELDDEEEIEVKVEASKKSNSIKKPMNDKKRYAIVGIAAAVVLVLVIVLAGFGNMSTSVKNGDKKTEVNRNTSTENLKKFYEAFDSEELNVIFFASATCGYCTLEKPIIENISKDYDMNYYPIDASTLSQDELSEIIKALGIRGATPTTVIVKKGEVVATNEGYLDGKPFVEFFVKNGVLKEGSTYKEEDQFKEINYSKFKDISKNDKVSLVYLDSSACQGCIEARSILNKIAKNNDFDINYLSAGSLSEDDVNDLVEKRLKDMGYDEETYKKESQIKIPLLLVIKNNKIKDYILESTDEKEYTKVLKKYDFIK